MSFNKIQLTKLLIHTLKELGYKDTSITLQKESGGIQIESNLVQCLFKCINDSNYTPVTFKFLAQLPLDYSQPLTVTTTPDNLYQLCQNLNIKGIDDDDNNDDKLKIENIIITDHTTVIDHFNKQYKFFQFIAEQIKTKLSNNNNNRDLIYPFLISLQIMLLFQRQYFIELITLHQDFSLAIQFLRNTITKFQSLLDLMVYYNNTTYIYWLSPFISENNENSGAILLKDLTNFITNPQLLQSKYPNEQTYKLELINIISKVINPDDLIPSGRLITLLKQSIQYQKSQNGVSLFDEDYNDDEMIDYSKYSLLEDNKNFNGYYKFINTKILNESNGEIWYLQFSPDGKYLASAIANDELDKEILIYDVENDFQVYKILAGNIHAPLYLSFSPDGKYLVSCPFNGNANIYFIHGKGEPLTTYNTTSPSNERINPEMIFPVDSLDITSDFKLKSHTYSHSVTSPQYNQESTSTKTPLRIWCCDWFHTPQHENIIILGSPDRGVIFYNFETKSILLTMSQSTVEQTNGGYFDESSSIALTSRRMLESFRVRTGNGGNNDNDDINNDSDGDINMDNTPTKATFDDSKFPHVHDLKISNDDKYLILMSNEKFIQVYDISRFPTNEQLSRGNNSFLESFTPKKVSQIVFDDKIKLTCISLPEPTDIDYLKSYYPTDPKLLEHLILVNATPNRLELWNYKENIFMQRFSGQIQEKYIIRSCFGYNNKIVISGSEDGRIYIWDKLNGKLLNVLPGHTQPKGDLNKINSSVATNCNIVAWNPTDKNLFVSGGDDGLVKVWKITYGK